VTTNAGQTQRIETEDINKVIKAYKEDKTSITIPVYKDVIGIPAKVADLIFKKTSDFSDIK
jgi:CTP:molybdopterin cytidylyltransferase MocA